MSLEALVLAVTVGASSAAAAPEGWFTFALAGGDGSLGAADLSFLNEAPAGRDGPVAVRDGRFVDGRGRRIRFFATNLTGTACFPDPLEAPKLAKRLRALGFNLVRLHFMDIPAPDGLFASDGASLDPGQLERLDGLVWALKAEGIYVDMNLHVARRYPGIEGEAAGRFGMGKVLDRFYPPFVEMQRKYARDLLGHVNAKTGVSYAREPAVALVELNNENTLLPFWGPSVRDLPEPYAGELRREWNAWLNDRYGSTRKLRAAWKSGERSGGGEMIRNGSMRDGTAGWDLQSAGGAKAELAAVGGVLRWIATRAGSESWHLQVHQAGLEFRDGVAYEVSFRARADRPMELDVTTMLAVDPWSGLGLEAKPALGNEWKAFLFRFTGRATRGPRGRLNFSTGNSTGTVELSDISMREAPVTGLPDRESLEAGTVALRLEGGTPAATLDAWTFLVETERKVTASLMKLLREELGVVAPVCDTQAGYGGAAGVLREAAYSDYLDEHAYWEHPEFPGRGWDPANWRIPNTDQVAVPWGGVIEDLALRRVEGKPFTVSEYNIPAPSDHAAACLPMLASLAAFQDWDAIFPYTFLDFRRDWASERLLGFFDFAGHPGKLVSAPAAALAFRLGLVKPGREPVTVTLPRDAAARLLAEGHDAAGLRAIWENAGVPLGMVSVRRMQLRVSPPGSTITATPAPALGATRESDTGEITWVPGKDRPVFTVEAPAFRTVAGAISGRGFRLGDVGIDVGKFGNPSGCVTLAALDGKPLRESARVLVSAAARVENQGMGWNADRTTVGRDWGKGPTIAETVPVSLVLPGPGWEVHALDGAGRPGAKMKVASSDAGSRVALNAPGSPPSLWFLLTK